MDSTNLDSVDVNPRVRPFYERFKRPVLCRARALLGDDDAAKDVMQEVFLRVMTSSRQVLEQPAPLAWLYRVTTNLSLNWKRNDRRRRELLDLHRVSSIPSHAQPEMRVMARQLLRRVPDETRDVAVHFYVDEMTRPEIAAVVGVSTRTVGYRLAAFRDMTAPHRDAS